MTAPRLTINLIDPDNPAAPPRMIHGRTLTNDPADGAALHGLRQVAAIAEGMAPYLETITLAAECRDAVIVSLCAGEIIERARRLRDADMRLLLALSRTHTKAQQ